MSGTAGLSARRTKSGLAGTAFAAINTVFMVLVLVVTIYPLYYCIMLSFNQGRDTERGLLFLLPRKFTLENYEIFFRDRNIPYSLTATVGRTILGSALSVYMNALVAYTLIKKELKGRRVYISLGIFTMYFSGGLIPFYILIKQLGLLDNFLVYVIPFLLYFFNILIYMSFFRELPSSLSESARIDGANEFLIFNRIILPLSSAVVATIGLFYSVWHWNSWFESYIYVSNPRLQTIPAILVKMINQSLAETMLTEGRTATSSYRGVTGNSVRLAAMTVAILPILAVYPFLQKYFVKGIMIGSVKG